MKRKIVHGHDALPRFTRSSGNEMLSFAFKSFVRRNNQGLNQKSNERKCWLKKKSCMSYKMES
jgi:hypothetical protein